MTRWTAAVLTLLVAMWTGSSGATKPLAPGREQPASRAPQVRPEQVWQAVQRFRGRVEWLQRAYAESAGDLGQWVSSLQASFDSRPTSKGRDVIPLKGGSSLTAARQQRVRKRTLQGAKQVAYADRLTCELIQGVIKDVDRFVCETQGNIEPVATADLVSQDGYVRYRLTGPTRDKEKGVLTPSVDVRLPTDWPLTDRTSTHRTLTDPLAAATLVIATGKLPRETADGSAFMHDNSNFLAIRINSVRLEMLAQFLKNDHEYFIEPTPQFIP